MRKKIIRLRFLLWLRNSLYYGNALSTFNATIVYYVFYLPMLTVIYSWVVGALVIMPFTTDRDSVFAAGMTGCIVGLFALYPMFFYLRTLIGPPLWLKNHQKKIALPDEQMSAEEDHWKYGNTQ